MFCIVFCGFLFFLLEKDLCDLFLFLFENLRLGIFIWLLFRLIILYWFLGVIDVFVVFFLWKYERFWSKFVFFCNGIGLGWLVFNFLFISFLIVFSGFGYFDVFGFFFFFNLIDFLLKVFYFRNKWRVISIIFVFCWFFWFRSC